MMKMIYGRSSRDDHDGGIIDVLGYDPARDELAIKYLSGVVPQDNNLDDELNVIQNLMIYSKFYGLSGKVARERIKGLLELSGTVGEDPVADQGTVRRHAADGWSSPAPC